MNRRVVISGAGVLCPIGGAIDEFWRNCLHGKTNVLPIPDQWLQYSDYRSRFWSPLPSLEFSKLGFTKAQIIRTDPVALLAIYSTKQALCNANLHLSEIDVRSNTYRISKIDSARTGVYMGTGIGGANSFLDNHYHPILSRIKHELKELVCDIPKASRGHLSSVLDRMFHLRRVNPFIVSMLMPNAVSAQVGLTFGINGPNTTYCVACASGTSAIGHAYRAIKTGIVDIAIAGGAEYLDDYYGYIFKGFDEAGTFALGTKSDQVNKPFDRARSGFLFSQGGAVTMILEDYEIAKARKAPILSEIVGFSEAFDSHSIMSLSPDGGQITRMIAGALDEAKVHQSGVQYVNAHGTGTKNNDEVEAEVLERVFGTSVLINTTKSLVGHTIGASGALEALVTVLSLRDQTTHVCKNLKEPISKLNFVRKVKPYSMEVGFSHSFAFGGHNAGLVLKRFCD